MSAPDILSTKLYIPPARSDLVFRPRLIERLNEGLNRKLVLISAPAGFGKSTLLSAWIKATRSDKSVSSSADPLFAWLSLDEGDKDPVRFLTYFIAALNEIEAIETPLGEGALGMLQSPQPPPFDTALTSLINELATLSGNLVMILDDYHRLDSAAVDDALALFIERMPPQIHLVFATRADPQLPLARLRAQDQLTEIRATDLRFTSAETADFLNRVMGLGLSPEEIVALETRTEGWIAGLQLAAISMQRMKDTSGFIQSFTGSHHFILDYLIEEVLERQSEEVQTFLLATAILDRLTGSLCDALTGQTNGQETLEMLDRANLFIVPLDSERRWYRYHHLFRDLLRQRLSQIAAPSNQDDGMGVDELHVRASKWFEENGLAIEAFHHATQANELDRAVRLIEGGGMPLAFRGALNPILQWLESLPPEVMDARPLLWVSYASAELATGLSTGVEEKLQAAEKALQEAVLDEETRDIIGRIAATRATLAWGQDQADIIIAQSERALEYLHPDNLPFRTSTAWKLASAYHLQGDRMAASQAYRKAIAICESSGNLFINIIASTGLGEIQIEENQLYEAAETYRRVLHLVGDQPLAVTCGAHLGLANILYEWDDLDAALEHGELSVQLSRGIDSTDAFAQCALGLARMKLTLGDVTTAAKLVSEAEQFVRQHNFLHRMPDVLAMNVLILIEQGRLSAAGELAEEHELPMSQIRVHLARGNPSEALAVLEPWRRKVEARGRVDEQLKLLVLQALVLQAKGETDQAAEALAEALDLAAPGGFVRTFVDEGPPLARILWNAHNRGVAPDYVQRLLNSFLLGETGEIEIGESSVDQSGLIEPLSDRELEVLQHVAEGYTNREIADRLYLSTNTVKVHTRNIYGKLGVNNRTQAVAKARELGVLSAS